MILTDHPLFPKATGFRTHAAALRHAQKTHLAINTDKPLMIVATRRKEGYDDHVVVAVLTERTNILATFLASKNILCVSA